MRFAELMIPDFSLIRESASIAEARSKLLSDDYLVVTSDENIPHSVITTSDLPDTEFGSLTACIPKLPPTVIIGCDLEIETIHDAAEDYLFNAKSRAAAVLGEHGLIGIVPTEVLRSHLTERAVKIRIARTLKRWRQRTNPKIEFSFGGSGSGGGGSSPIRSLRVAAAGTLGGSRVLAAVPQKCKKCGWLAFYHFIRPTTKCTNPDQNVEPQPWPHTLA